MEIRINNFNYKELIIDYSDNNYMDLNVLINYHTKVSNDLIVIDCPLGKLHNDLIRLCIPKNVKVYINNKVYKQNLKSLKF